MGKTLTGSFTEYCVDQCQEIYTKGTRCPASRNIDADVLCFRYSSLIKFFWTANKVLAWPDYPGSKDYPSHLLKISTSIHLHIYFSMHIADHACALWEHNKINIKISGSSQNSNVLVWNPKLKCPYGFLLDFYMLSCLLSVCWLKSWCWFSPWTILLLWFQLRWLRAQV